MYQFLELPVIMGRVPAANYRNGLQTHTHIDLITFYNNRTFSSSIQIMYAFQIFGFRFVRIQARNVVGWRTNLTQENACLHFYKDGRSRFLQNVEPYLAPHFRTSKHWKSGVRSAIPGTTSRRTDTMCFMTFYAFQFLGYINLITHLRVYATNMFISSCMLYPVLMYTNPTSSITNYVLRSHKLLHRACRLCQLQSDPKTS